MLERSHSGEIAKPYSPAPATTPAKGVENNGAQPAGKSDATGPALPIAVAGGHRGVLPLRFSSSFLPVLPPAAAPRPENETVTPPAAVAVDSKHISGRETATSAAVEDTAPSNPEPVALPSVLADDAPEAVTADQDNLAFAARLTSAVIPAQTNIGAAQPAPDPLNRPKAAPSSTAPQTYMAASTPTGDGGSQASGDPAKSLVQQFAKPDTSIPVAASPKEFVSSSKAPTPPDVSKPAIEANVETPPIATNSSHDIRVRVSDNQGGTLDVRFLDLGSEVRVSVRTPDNNLAQSLRGNLTELTQHLSVGGIQSEMWHPGAGSSFQGSSQQSPDSDSHSNQSGHGAGRETKQGNPQQQQPKQNQPRWLQEFELSTESIQPKEN